MLLNIEFADGNKFVSYYDDSTYHEGCPTCDYGSEYINDITITTTNNKINVSISQMYEYAFTTADAIKMFAMDIRSMTEKEFVDYIVGAFKEYPVEYIKVNHEALKI